VSLERKGDITRAVIFSSIAWTIIHVNPYWAIQIFISGIFIGFLAWRTNSVFPSIIVHGINNLLSLIYVNIQNKDSLNWYTLGDHVSPVWIVVAAGLLFFSIQQLSSHYTKINPE
jgi:membrane protease YdiL (CAAX protease family)